jgi:hypothetical protein
MQEGGMNPGKRSAVREDVSDHRPILSKHFRIANNRNVVAYSYERSERALQKRLSAKIQEGFVLTHSRTLASRENEAHARWSSLLVQWLTRPQMKRAQSIDCAIAVAQN